MISIYYIDTGGKVLQEFGRIFYEHQKSVLWCIGEYVCALCTISPNMMEAFCSVSMVMGALSLGHFLGRGEKAR